ncbi:MAG TPA: hypothetical protein PK743_05925 [Luteimonas sp.]|nr:hypothetical protein [Luteimonas sp.]
MALAPDFVFDLPLLQAISDWQRGGNSVKRGAALKQACTNANLPINYRESPLVCFRQIALPKGGVWALLGEDNLPEKISSWTLDLVVAKTFKGGVPPQNGGFQGVIFNIHPPAGSVIVNLREVYRDPAFQAALAQHEASIDGYHEGAGRWGDSQSEVVLEIGTVNQQDVFSLGEWSSSPGEIVDMAAVVMHGTEHIPQEERDALLLHAEKAAGPAWLEMEPTKRVLARLKSPAEFLREVKKLQEQAKK